MSLLVPDHDFAEPLRQLCQRAAAAIMQHYHSAGAADHAVKDDASPLTAADMAAHDILLAGLADFGLPVLSEESAPDIQAQRRQWPRYWLVDPLDGTREFLARTDEFTVNIALVEGHTAVLGVVAVPVAGAIYFGAAGAGAWCWSEDQWRPLRTRPLQPAQPVDVLTSRRHRDAALDYYLAGLEAEGYQARRSYAGSALKFVQLATGEGDCYPRFSPCCEWDTGAGQALVEAAGGAVVDIAGRRLDYNARDSLFSPHFIAVADPQQPLWANLLDRQRADSGVD